MRKIIASSLILAMLSSSAIMCGALNSGTAYDTSLSCNEFLHLCEDACQEFASSIESSKSIPLPPYAENPVITMIDDIDKTATKLRNASERYKAAENECLETPIDTLWEALTKFSKVTNAHYADSTKTLANLRHSIVDANKYAASMAKSLEELQDVYNRSNILQDNLLAIYNPQNPHNVPYSTQIKLAYDVNDCYLAAADVKNAVDALPYKLKQYQDAYDGLYVKTYQLMGTIDNLVYAFKGQDSVDISGANTLNKRASIQLVDFCSKYADILEDGAQPIQTALSKLSADFDFSNLSQINSDQFDKDTDAMVQ